MTSALRFTGGRIFTGRRYCAALLVEDGEVTVAGSEAEVHRSAPTGTDVRALGGRLVLPGLIDAHLHVAETTRRREGLDVSGAASLDALAARVRVWADSHPDGPIVGRGVDPESWPGGDWPDRHDLDRITVERALTLTHASGHALIVNSRVLTSAGVDRATPDPAGGRFGRDPNGSPDGRIFEAAVPWLLARGPEPERVEPAALLRTLRATATLGLTTVGAMSASPEEAIALRQLANSGAWAGRVRVYLRGDRWRQYFQDPGGPSGPAGRFEVLGVKAFTDGAFGPRTALLSRPYEDDPTNSGIAVGSDLELEALVQGAAREDLAPALHAIGDRALLRALERLRGVRLRNRRQPRVEHASLVPPPVLRVLEEVRPALVVQPGFLWSDHWLDRRLGAERARWAYPFRTLVEHGLLVAGSSDAPYDPIDPWRGLKACVQRTDPMGRSANPDPSEAVDAATAIRLYTANAGVVFGEPLLGLLEAGAPADLVEVQASSLDAAIAAGAGIVRASWVAGERLAPDAGD